MSLKGIGISIINSKPQEIAYLSIYGIDLKYSNAIDKKDAISENNETIQFFIKNAQIDYCLNDWDKKVIFVPKNQILPYNEEKLFKEDKDYYPFLQVLICRQKTNNLKTDEKVEKFPQIDFILQEFVINLSQNSLEKIIQTLKEYYSILTILHIEQRNLMERQSNLLTTEINIPEDNFLMGGVNLEKIDSGMLLFNYIFFSAIKFEININFNISDSEKFNIPIFLRKLEKENDENSDEIKFENGQIKFREMIYENDFIGLSKLYALLIKHYQTQTINQFYQNLGFKNLITNPIKLLDSVGTGFIELVNETRKGFMLGPGYFGKRLNLGIHSLINDLYNEGKEYLTTATGTLLNMQNDSNIGEIKKQIERNRNKYITKGNPLELKSESPCLNGIFLNPYKDVVIDGVQSFYKKLKNSNNNNNNHNIQSSAIIFEMKNDSIKYFIGKVPEEVRFRHPRVITENETIKVYKENLAEVQNLLEDILRIYDTNKILFFADIKKEDNNNYNTVIMTDKIFIIIDEKFKSVFELKVDDVEKVNVMKEKDYFNLYFESKGSGKKSFKFYEQKVVSKLYDLFRQQIREKVDTERMNTEKSLRTSVKM